MFKDVSVHLCRYKYEDEPEEHVRLAEVSQILATYKTSGIVEFLPENPYRGQPRTTVEYQASCVALQINRLGSYRHFLFVTGKICSSLKVVTLLFISINRSSS